MSKKSIKKKNKQLKLNHLPPIPIRIFNPIDDIASFMEHAYGFSKGKAYRKITNSRY